MTTALDVHVSQHARCRKQCGDWEGRRKAPLHATTLARTQRSSCFLKTMLTEMHHFAYLLSNRYPSTSSDAHRNDPPAPRDRCKSHFQVLSHHVFTFLDAEQAVLDVLAKTLADVSTELGHRSFVDPKVMATRPRASSCPSYSSLSGPTTRERLATRLQKNIRRDARNEGFSPALGG